MDTILWLLDHKEVQKSHQCMTFLDPEMTEKDEKIYYKVNHGLIPLLDTSNDPEIFPYLFIERNV